MTDSDRGVPDVRRNETGTAWTPPRSAGLIRLSSRVGVWGFVLALVPVLGDAFGMSLPPGLVGPVSSFGLIASGLGTAVASVLVWRSLPRKLSPLKVASALGIPFGITLTLGGVALRRPLGAFADAVDAIGPVVLALAVLVVGLLVAGFVSGRSRD